MSSTLTTASSFLPKHTPRPASATPVLDSSKPKHSNKPERRAGSAHTPTSAGSVSSLREPIDLPRRRRVKSAVAGANRLCLNIPADKPPWGSKEWGETCYSSNFSQKKPIVHSKPRPASATRMNNPHPSQMFLQWRVPTRIHPHSRSRQVDPAFLKDIQENFYQDYSADENKTGGAMHEVPITNVAKIPFPGNTKKLEVTGSRLPLADKQKGLTLEQFPSQDKAKVLERTLQPSSYLAYQTWVHEASDDEKRVLAKMLKAASVEDSRMKKVLSEVFTKHSLKHIKEWMHGADQNDLSMAIKIVDELSKRSHTYSSRNTTGHTHSQHCTMGLHRYGSWPKQKSPSINDTNFSIHGRNFRPQSAEKCSDRSTSDAGSIYKSIRSNKLKLKYTQAPVLWHHKVKPPQVSRLLNRGCVFGLPHRPQGQHFAIHPEWPIA